MRAEEVFREDPQARPGAFPGHPSQFDAFLVHLVSTAGMAVSEVGPDPSPESLSR